MDMQAPPAALLSLSCIAVRDETPTVKTFRLRADSGPVGFTPGQALVLKVPLPGGPVWRSFTISGGAGGDLELTIKAQAPGGATRWLHENLRDGDSIEARPHAAPSRWGCAAMTGWPSFRAARAPPR